MNPNLRACLFLFAVEACVCAASAAVQTDIEYGSAGGEKLLLDVSVPDGAGPFPAVILVHGGGWNAGDKSGGPQKGYMAPLHEPLSRAGFAWFSINYRLAPKHHFPAPVEDVETAIRWVKAHAAQYHIDPARIALSGESAGAHLAAMAVVRANADTRVAAIVPLYGRFDLMLGPAETRTLSPSVSGLLGIEKFGDGTLVRLKEASPVAFVKAGLPPFLLVHGDADDRVEFVQSLNMQAALRKAGVPCDLITIKGGGHGMLGWDAFAPGFKGEIVAWLQRTLAVKNKNASAP